MTQKTWSTVEVSAYLDGELEPQREAAFEADLIQDPALRQRVEQMKQIVSLVRATPLREPPRNYILTPAMVGETKTEPEQRRTRMPFLVMRLATSFVALLFVVTFGLTVYQRGFMPGMATQSSEAPVSTALVEREEAVSEEAVEAPEETGIMASKAEVSEEVPPPPEGTLSPEEEMALAAMPESEEDVEGRGIGGGGEPGAAETPVGVLQAPPVEEEEVSPEAEAVVESFQAEEVELSRADEARSPDEQAAPAEDVIALREPSLRLPTWLSVSLGVITLVMAGVTFWLSRRELG